MNEQQALEEMGKHTKQHPAVGIGHHETVKTKAVKGNSMKSRKYEILYVVGWCVLITGMFWIIWR